MENLFKVKKHTLLFVAGLVWGMAGSSVMKIGLKAYPDYMGFVNYLLSIAVYIVFQIFVFGKMVKKHTRRITAYEEDQYIYKFFDGKSFLIMACMMTMGIGLRYSGVVPLGFIAVFYTGLGASLLTAGIIFIVNFIREVVQGNREKSR